MAYERVLRFAFQLKWARSCQNKAELSTFYVTKDKAEGGMTNSYWQSLIT